MSHKKMMMVVGLAFGAVILGLILSSSRSAVAQGDLAGSDWGGGVSSTTYMASHREQHHSVVTSDGAIHVILNTGATDGNALKLFSSIDGGKTWAVTYSFTGTSAQSTDDISLSGTTLRVAYDTHGANNASSLVYATLVYANGQWTLQSSENVAATPRITYSEPAFATDAGGNLWLAAVVLNTINNNQIIVLYSKAAGANTWSNTGLAIPNPNSARGANGIEHAPRPVYIPSGTGNIGLLYQSYTCLYWVTINGTQVSSPTKITCSLPLAQQTVVDTAFSVATDAAGNQYLGYVVSSTASGIYAQTYLASQNVWSASQYLNQASAYSGAVYVKTSLVTNGSTTSAYMFVNNKGALAFYASPDASHGATNYILQGNLTHAAAGAGQSYTNPRIEVPQYLTASSSITTIPVWEQYTIDAAGDQSLIYWPLPLN